MDPELIIDRGEVFGWGNSEYGQLSSVTEEQQMSNPTKLSLPGIGKIIDIASGGSICLILNGKVKIISIYIFLCK